MALPADISFDDYVAERTIGGVVHPPLLWFVGNTPPYRIEHSVGGRSETYGHDQGILRRGVGYWRGIVEFHRRFVKEANYPGIGYVRSAIAELADSSKSFKVPMDTQYGKGLVRFVLRSSGDEIDHASVAGDLVTAAGTTFGPLNDGGAGIVDVVLLPGAYFTIDNELYMATASAGQQTVTVNAVESIPEFPSGTGDTIELDKPFAVGRVPVGETIAPVQRNDTAGGWTLPWEQAHD